MKDSYYFSHDYYSRKDPKISALLSDFDLTGLGLFWVLIEIMHEQGGRIKKFPKLYDGLAHELKIEKNVLMKQIEAMLHEYELLKEDENYIWSERVLRNIEEREAKKKSKIESGRLGGLKSGYMRSKRKHRLSSLEANEAKERKGKEIIDNIDKTSKNSLLPCTDIELQEIANKTKLPIETVRNKHTIILNKIKAGEFKNKTVYLTLENWLIGDLEKGYIKQEDLWH